MFVSVILKFATFHIFYQNVRGLRSKHMIFFCNLPCTNYDALVLSETWLNSNVYNRELFDSNYNVFRRDRETTACHNRKDGGGVLIAVAKKFVANRMSNWESNCEDLWVTIQVKHNFKIALCAIYLPPPVQNAIIDQFINNFNSLVDSINGFHTILIGDFNLGQIDWSIVTGRANSCPISHSVISQKLVDFTHMNNLSQCNNIFNSSGRILDLVLTDLSDCKVTEALTGLCKIDPYHPPLEIILEYIQENKLEANNSTRLNFRKADYPAIKKHLSNTDWHDLYRGVTDPNIMLNIFYDNLNHAIDQYVPPIVIRNSSKPPWFDYKLLRLQRESDKYRKKYKMYKKSFR